MRILLVSLTFSLFLSFIHAQEQLLRELDIVIQEQRSIIKGLEELEMYELNRDIGRLKKNLDALRQIRMKIASLQESSGGSLAQGVKELKEQIRSLYLILSEIRFISQETEWNESQKQWLALQSSNPDFMSRQDLSFYNNQLQKLMEDFRKLEIKSKENHKKTLDAAYALYLRLKEDRWVNLSARWKGLERSWEKTWESRSSGGLETAPVFQDLYSELLELESQSTGAKKKAIGQIQDINKEVQVFYNTFAQVRMATRDKRWIEYETRCKIIRDTAMEGLSPESAEKLKNELIELRTILWNYKNELSEQLNRNFQKAQAFYDKLRYNSWGQMSDDYKSVMEEWQVKWEKKTNLELADANDVENILAGLERIQNNAQNIEKEVQAEVADLKEDIRNLIVALEPAALAQKDARWFEIQKTWQDMQYVSVAFIQADAMKKYRENLKNLSKSLLEINTEVLKTLDRIFAKARDDFESLSQNTWANTLSAWPDAANAWKTKWAWKKDLQLADMSELQNIVRRFDMIKAQASERQEYMHTEVRKKIDSLRAQFEFLNKLGSKEPAWPSITARWNELLSTDSQKMSPTQIEQYFTSLKEFDMLLVRFQQALQESCSALFAKTQEKYENLWKDPWVSLVEEWSETSNQWVLQRPLPGRVSLESLAIIQPFYEKFALIESKVQNYRNQQFGQIEIMQKRLSEVYDSLKAVPLITQDYRWAEIQSQWQRVQNQEYKNLNKESFIQYQQRVSSLGKLFDVLRQDALAELLKIWQKSRKTYLTFSQNPWTRLLMKRFEVDREWANSWENKNTIALSDAGPLMQFAELLERCCPFWWRTQIPQKDIPEDSFILDMTEIKSEGMPSVPQWSSHGNFLAFLSTSQNQYSIKVLDIMSGNIKTIELYDSVQRWVGFPSWSPLPMPDILSFCGKKQGVFDVYSTFCSDWETFAITNSPEYEKIPKLCVVDEKPVFFFIQGNDLYFKKEEEAERLFMTASKCNAERIDDFAVRWQSNEQKLKIVFCVSQGKQTPVYFAEAEYKSGGFYLKDVHKVSELRGLHFAPQWTKDGLWILCYIQEESGITGISQIHAETARETLLSQGNVKIPQGSEMRFKPPEIVSNPLQVMYFQESEQKDISTLISSSIGDSRNLRTLSDSRNLPVFHSSDYVTLSPDRTFLAWTYWKEGTGRRLVVAIVKMP